MIDNFRVYIIVKYNSKTLIQTVFLVRQPALHMPFVEAVVVTNGRDARRNRMAGSRAEPPVGANSIKGQSEPCRKEAAEYIGSLLKGLQSLAQEARMPFLAYLLTMALEEANTEKAKGD